MFRATISRRIPTGTKMCCLAALLPILCLCASEQPLTMSDVSVARERLTRVKSLTEGEKTEISSFYDQVAQSLQEEIRWKAQQVGHARTKAVIASELAAARAAAAMPLAGLPPAAPDETAEKVDDELARVRNDRASQTRLRDELTKLKASLTMRADAIAVRRGEIAEALQSIADEVSVLALAAASPQWEQANRMVLQARRQSLEQELQMLATEREALDLRRQLIPLQRDACLLKLEAAEQYLGELKVRQANARIRDVKKSMESAINQAQALANGFPQLSTMAAQIASHATELWGPAGIQVKNDRVAAETEEMRTSIGRFKEITTMTLRRFQNSVVFAPASDWLPPRVEKFGNPGEVGMLEVSYFATETVARRDMFRLEEEHNREPAFETEVQQILAASGKHGGDADYAQFESRVRSTLQLQRSVAAEFLTTGRIYVNSLAEAHRTAEQLRIASRELQLFVLQHVLWARSVNGAVLPSPSGCVSALVWFFSPHSWSRIVAGFTAPRALYLLWAGGLLGIVALFKFRERISRWSIVLRSRAQSGRRVWHLFCSLVLGMVPLAPVPLAIAYAGWVIGQAGAQVELGRAIAAGAYNSALFLYPAVLVRRMLSEGGATDSLMHWPPPVREALDGGVRKLAFVFTPLWFVSTALARDGMQYDSDASLQLHHNSLGRLCFMAGALSVLFIGRGVLKSGGAVANALGAGFNAHGISRLRVARFVVILVFSSAFLLALTGFYVTAILLVRNVLRTGAWTFALILLAYIVRQWRLDQRGRVEAARSRENEDAHRADLQVQRLTRFGLTLVWILGASLIWSAELPALSLLKRVELFPELRMVTEKGAPPDDQPTAVAAPRAGQEASPPANPAVAPVPTAPEASQAVPPGEPLYLSDVLVALFIGVLISMLVRNIPGLLQFTLFRRLQLDVGGQYAVSTIARYLVVIVGLLILSEILGLNWSKVQWLAAALTFGVGFGLQEIFANFAAGLILLLDRSIRVGDVVTVGDLSGIVARIRMRATTVTLWDRSDMVVPNKEFITNKLVNWTLSHPETRVDLKVGVAYGSDVEQVREVLMRVAQAHPAVLKNPAPEVLLTEFGENAVRFQLQVFGLFSYGRPVLMDELYRAVVSEFRKLGIVIALPQIDVHLKAAAAVAQANG